MKMWLRAAPRMSPKNPLVLYIKLKEDHYLSTERLIDFNQHLSSNLYTLHCGSHIALGFGTNPFLTRL